MRDPKAGPRDDEASLVVGSNRLRKALSKYEPNADEELLEKAHQY